jgi:hypothetical protein
MIKRRKLYLSNGQQTSIRMLARIPKIFSVRTTLIIVACIAAAAFIVRDYVRVRNAREHFAMMRSLWEVKNITFADVILASEVLASEEAESLWISRQAATIRHLEFLNYLLRYLNSGAIESNSDTVERWRQNVHENVRKRS